MWCPASGCVVSARAATGCSRHRIEFTRWTPLSAPSAAVRALSVRLTRQQQTHREEVARLGKALEVAQGGNLELRRRLARWEADGVAAACVPVVLGVPVGWFLLLLCDDVDAPGG